jgi:hypothetical protein
MAPHPKASKAQLLQRRWATAANWANDSRRIALGAVGSSTFRTSTAANTGASGRTAIGQAEGLYDAFFTQTNITKIALVNGSSSSLEPTAHSRYSIFDLVESTGSETIYNILDRLDRYQEAATGFHGNDSVWGSPSVLNHTAGTNGYSGLLSASSSPFVDQSGTTCDKFCVMGINRDSDNDIQALAFFRGNLESGKADSWRTPDPSQTFWSYWGDDFHSNSQNQRIGNSLQTPPGISTGVSNYTGTIYLMAFTP